MSYVDTPLGRMSFIGNRPPEWFSNEQPRISRQPELLPKLSAERQLAHLLINLGAYFFTAPDNTLWRTIWENVAQRERTDAHLWMQGILTQSRPELTAICREHDCLQYIQLIWQQWHALGYDERTDLQAADIRRVDREQYARFADFFQFMMGRITYFRSLIAHEAVVRQPQRVPEKPPTDILDDILSGTYDPRAYGRASRVYADSDSAESAPKPTKRKKAKTKRQPATPVSPPGRLLASGKKRRVESAEVQWDSEIRIVGNYEFVGFTEKQAQLVEQIICTLLPDSEHPVTRIEFHLDQRTVGIRGSRGAVKQWNVDTDIVPNEGILVIYPSFFSLKAADQQRMIVYELQKCINYSRIYTNAREPKISAALKPLEKTFPFWSPQTEPMTEYIDTMAQGRTAEKVPAMEVNFYQAAMIMAFMRVEPDKIRERFLDADGNVFDAFQTMLCVLDNTDKKTLVRRVRAASKIPRITLKS